MNLTSKRKSIFLIVTLIVLGLDLTFVVINYFSSKTALNSSLMKNAQAHKEAFNVSFSMINNNMLQMSTLMAKNKVLNQIFLRGKKAVEEEGGGAGKKKADKARKELLRIIKTGWNEMMKKFDVRQLHYHL